MRQCLHKQFIKGHIHGKFLISVRHYHYHWLFFCEVIYTLHHQSVWKDFLSTLQGALLDTQWQTCSICFLRWAYSPETIKLKNKQKGIGISNAVSYSIHKMLENCREKSLICLGSMFREDCIMRIMGRLSQEGLTVMRHHRGLRKYVCSRKVNIVK